MRLFVMGKMSRGHALIPRDLGLYSRSINKPVSAPKVLEYVAESAQPAQALKNMAPQTKLYQAMQKEMEQLFYAPQQSLKPITIGRRSIRPRTYHSAILNCVLIYKKGRHTLRRG